MIKLRVLTDNRVRKGKCFAEHGLSFLIKTDKQSVLFDTGYSDVYLKNDIHGDVNNVKYIILSHGHYDHCSGLKYFPFDENDAKVIVQRDAFRRKLSLDTDGSFKDAGVDFDTSVLKDRIIYPDEPLHLDDMIIVGRIPSITDFEEVPEGFFVETEKGIVHDMMQDEQMLIVEEEDSISIFVGCSHPGIINCIRYAKKLIPEKRVRLVAGGMHLNKATPLRLQLTIQHLIDMEIEKIAPCHCTGFDAMCEMKRSLKNAYIDLYAGEDFMF